MFSRDGSVLRRKLQGAALSCLLALNLFFPQSIRAWGNTGHEAVAYVAWQQLKPDIRTRVIALLKQVPTLHSPDKTKSVPGYADWLKDLPAGLSQDQQDLYLFMRAATWPDTIKHQWLKDSDTPPPHMTVDVNIGYTDTASHGYWHFVDSGFASDSTLPPPTPVPNAATQIAALREAISSNEEDALKSYDLIWLEHLVGDIHQPLHGTVRYYKGAGDAGGNSVKIKLPTALRTKFNGSAPSELHAFWDDLPGQGQPASALTGAASFAGALPAAPDDKIGDTDAANWATESLNLAKQDAYGPPIGKAPSPAYLITTAYYDTALQDAKDRIALAGARLAKLINDNLR